MARTQLTDDQWERIAPLLPGKAGDRGRTGADNRNALEAILWIARTGAPWHDLPAEFGKWMTAYQRSRRWARGGVFERIFEATNGHLDLNSVQVDGTFMKAHQHATGAQKRKPARAVPEAAGDREEPRLAHHEADGAGRPFGAAGELITDKAYDSNAVRADLASRGGGGDDRSRTTRTATAGDTSSRTCSPT